MAQATKVVTLRAAPPPPPPKLVTVYTDQAFRDAYTDVESALSAMRSTFSSTFTTTSKLAALPAQVEALKRAVAHLSTVTETKG